MDQLLAYALFVAIIMAVFCVLGAIAYVGQRFTRARIRRARDTVAAWLRAQRRIEMCTWPDIRSDETATAYGELLWRAHANLARWENGLVSSCHVRHDPYFIPEWMLEERPEYLKVQAS